MPIQSGSSSSNQQNSSPNQQGTANQQGQQGQQGTNVIPNESHNENYTQNHNQQVDQFENFWDNSQSSQQSSQEQSQSSQQQQSQPRAETAEETFNKHLEGLNFTEGLDFSKIQNEIAEGRFDSLNSMLQHVGRQAYKNALINSNTIFNQRLKQFENDILNKTRGATNTDIAVKEMNVSLPFTKDPLISPVASEVLLRFIKKGDSVEKAINGVKEFFVRSHKITAKDLGIQNPPKGRRTRISNQSQNHLRNDFDEEDDEETNWVDVFKGL